MYKNILIVKLSAIGDVIHALPVAHALKQKFPTAKITWVVEKPAYDLLTNNPDIDEIIIFEKKKFKTITGFLQYAIPFIKKLRQYKFDLALDLQGLFKSGIISYLSGAKERLVYENTREGSQFLGKRIVGKYSKGHVVQRCLDVTRALGCQIDKPTFTINITLEEQELTRDIALQAGLDLEKPYVVLALAANWPNKIWPYEHFAKLCNALYKKNIIPVMIGGPGDGKIAKMISAITEIPAIDLTGKTNLKQLAYIIKKAKVFLGGDTGPMHLAVAVETPTIALMGPTDILRNGPLGDRHLPIIVPYDCAGCWQRSCPKKIDCLSAITVERVYQGICNLYYSKFDLN